jgi:hypothetical protein
MGLILLKAPFQGTPLRGGYGDLPQDREPRGKARSQIAEPVEESLSLAGVVVFAASWPLEAIIVLVQDPLKFLYD